MGVMKNGVNANPCADHIILFLYEPVNSELRLAVLNFSKIFSLNCSLSILNL